MVRSVVTQRADLEGVMTLWELAQEIKSDGEDQKRMADSDPEYATAQSIVRAGLAVEAWAREKAIKLREIISEAEPGNDSDRYEAGIYANFLSWLGVPDEEIP